MSIYLEFLKSTTSSLGIVSILWGLRIAQFDPPYENYLANPDYKLGREQVQTDFEQRYS